MCCAATMIDTWMLEVDVGGGKWGAFGTSMRRERC